MEGSLVAWPSRCTDAPIPKPQTALSCVGPCTLSYPHPATRSASRILDAAMPGEGCGAGRQAARRRTRGRGVREVASRGPDHGPRFLCVRTHTGHSMDLTQSSARSPRGLRRQRSLRRGRPGRFRSAPRRARRSDVSDSRHRADRDRPTPGDCDLEISRILAAGTRSTAVPTRGC